MIPKWYNIGIISRIFRNPLTDPPVLLILWTFLSSIVSLSCSYSFIHPYWLLHPDHIHSFGVYDHCYNHPRLNRRVCDYFGGQFSFSNVPSEAWQATCVLFGSGCLLMLVSTLCAALCLCTSRQAERYLTVIGGGLQITAATTLISGVLMYPLGTSSSTVRYYCGSEGPYNTGHCTLGWAFATAVTGSAVAVFCPVIAYFVDTKTPTKYTEVVL